MTDLPCIMSAPMVLATLREVEAPGTGKTETRRLAWLIPRSWGDARPINYDERTSNPAHFLDPSPWQRVKAGDRLWVRENHQFRGADYGDSGGEIEWFRVYGSGGAADNWDPDFPTGWEPSPHAKVRELTEPDEKEGDDVTGYVTKVLPSIHMPRWASRLTLIVTATKIERLQDISEQDSLREGMTFEAFKDGTAKGTDARSSFSILWGKLHGPGAWDANPEVCAISFRPILANIDEPEAQAA